MSIPFHLGHSSHSLVKAFVNTTYAIRSAWLERTTRSTVRNEQAAGNNQEDSKPIKMTANSYTIPERSSRAPSLPDMDLPPSDSTMANEDTTVQTQDQILNEEEGMQAFGQRSRQLIKGIQKLESLGINTDLTSLPKFVVVGDQSHGKSSIIEAICGISLPRSAGTCTRAPFRITTTATRLGEDWSCKIALTRQYVCDRNGKWKNTGVSDPVPFTTVTDRTDLERVLHLAQIATLNPSLDPADLLHYGAPTTASQALSFSCNPINLYISGNELPELSMTDLPGSINVAPNESEQHLVGLIERLIKSYARDEKALILLVASMDQDLETSTGFRYVRDVKALGRSMGVLTKPDLLTKGRVELIRQILSGKVFKLGYDWFVTKNSSQEDLDKDVSHSEAREAEKAFFDRAPWSSNLLDHEERFGTENLQTAISDRLVAHIEEQLPDIIARVDERLRHVSQQLKNMPERPANPQQTVMDETQRLASSVVKHLRGDDHEAAFRAGFKGVLRGYRGQLQSVRPRVILATPGYEKPIVSLDSDDETMSDVPTPSKRHKANNGQAGSLSTPSKSTPHSGRASQDRFKGDSDHTSKAVFTLDQIHSALDRARGSDMPDSIDPKVIDRFIHQSSTAWPALTAQVLESVQRHVGEMLADCIADTLSTRSRTALFAKIMEAVQMICEDVHADEANHINHLVACEMYKPVTFARDLMKERTEEMRNKLQAARAAERVDEYYDTLEAEKKVKVPVGQKRKEKAKDLEFVKKELGADKYASEISAMAAPLAYYDLAACRLTDVVANHLEYGIMHGLEEKLLPRLFLELRVNDQEYCAQLLAEDPEREAERLRLLAEKARLEKAVEELQSLPGQH